ncbi:MAG: sensor histidine kinase [Sporichthyaceae bacterium]
MNEVTAEVSSRASATSEGRVRSPSENVTAHDRAIARMLELDRMKTEFVSTISHELRTPLTSMTGYLELLAEGSAGELTAEQQRLVAVAQRNCDRLHHLAEDLLLLSRGEYRGPEKARVPVSMDHLIADAGEAVMPLLREKSLSWAVAITGIPGVVDADPESLGRALLNLITNAVKFTPHGGSVTVSSWCEDDSVVLAVSDTGIGISEEDQTRVFDRFYRTDDARREAIQGSGLGLAIVNAIVEEHGGTVGVRSVKGEGSSFEIWLPPAE